MSQLQTPMEILLGIDENGMTNARKLYAFLELEESNFARWAKANIENNAFAVEGEDYKVFFMGDENPSGGRPGKNYKLTAALAKKLALQAQNERGEEARNYYITVETKSAELAASLQNLSPEVKALINLEINQQKMQKQLETQQETIASIKESVIERAPDEVWRKNVANQIARIAKMTNRRYEDVWNESYELLQSRGRCNLEARVRFRKARLLDEGACKTKINGVRKLDCIEDEPRLKEIFAGIVRDMSIRYTA